MYASPGAEKQRIRREARAAARGLDARQRESASRSIARQVLALPAWKSAKTVMAFASMAEEPDTGELIRAALTEGKTLLLPRCGETGMMRALRIHDPAELIPGRLGIPEPPEEEHVDVPEPDLILIPCVAAAPDGTRLGRGGGYYDRFLAGRRGLKVCLCFRALLRADLPAEETDVPMDLVITEAGD